MISLPISGFVDLQVNGYLGVDFSSPELTEESFIFACDALLQAGTVAFLPTIITSPLEIYERNLPILAAVLARKEFQGHILGIHLEGPFISPEPGAVGAHHPEWVLSPDINTFQQINEWAKHKTRLLTLAAEREGADELTRFAVGQGIVVSSGHSLANSSDLEQLALAGATALTHLGNGLPQIMHKFINPLWAGLADDHYYAMLIGDGHHIPDGILKAMIRAKGNSRTIIVSDAAPVAGLPPGQYTTLGNEVVLEKTGRLYNPQKGHLVGSSSTIFNCMNHLIALNIFSLDELQNYGFYNPLRLIRIPVLTIPHGKPIQYDADGNKLILPS